MNILIFRKLVKDLINHHILFWFVIFLVIDGVFGRSDLKTKLLLKNIRTHLAQKVDEVVQQKECELGLTLCKLTVNKEVTETDEEKSEEVLPPPKIAKGHHKPFIKVNPKDVIQTMMPKVHRSFLKRYQKKEAQEKLTTSFSDDEESESKETDEEIKDTFLNDKKQFSKFERVHVKPLVSISEGKGKISKDSNVKLGEKIKEKLKEKIKMEKDLKKGGTLVDDETKKKVVQKDLEKDFKNFRQLEREKKDIKKENLKKDQKIKQPSKTLDDIFSAKTYIFSVDSSDDKEDNLCAKHSNIYLKQLKKYKIWALMMFDASAKFPSGVLQGNANQLGDFDECLSINAVFKKAKPKNDLPAISGKYCLANIDITTNLEASNLKQALERVESFSFIRSTINDPGHFIPRFTSINWGLCVPAICPAENVKQFIDSKLEIYNDTNGLTFNVMVKEDNCVIKKDIKFQLHISMVLVLAFYLFTLMTVIYATYCDLNQTKKDQNQIFSKTSEDEAEAVSKDLTKNQVSQQTDENTSDFLKGKISNIIMAFSLKRNLKILFSESENNDSIECINGIKALFTIMLYFAHKSIPLGYTPFSNRIFLTKISNESSTVILRASQIYTDGFLLLSGLLTAYSLCKEITKKKKTSWVQKILSRIIRLTPALLAVLLFYAYVWDHLGSGPLWNIVVKKNSILCQNYLWRNLLYIQNFFAFENMCAPQTHHLAVDMQLSVLAPFFVYLIHEYDKVGIGVIQALFLMSSILRYISASNNELSVVIYHGISVTQLYKTANLLYGQTLCRASPYLMGVIVGYHLSKFKGQFKFPKSFAILGWIIAFSFGFYSIVFPSHMASREYQYNINEAAQYAALSPVSWSLALSYVIGACHLGFGGKLNEFLCHKSFLVFSRISYSFYLTQFLVFFYKIGVKRIPETFTFTGSFDVAEFFLIILASMIVTLLFDIPMIKIKQIILDIFFKDTPNAVTEIEESTLIIDDLERENDNILKEENLIENQQSLGFIKEEEEDFQEENKSEEEDSREEEDEDEEEEIPMQPLRRSITINFNDEADDKDWLKIKEEVSE